MTATEFVAAVSLKATGKLPTFTSGSTKWLKILGIGNFYIDKLTQEPNVDWSFLYEPLYSLGTVTNTDNYDIDKTEVYKVSDKPGDNVRIVHTDLKTSSNYDIVPHDDLKMYYGADKKLSYRGFYCAVISSSLVFNHTFIAADPQFGGTIYLPAYLKPDHLVADADEVIPEIQTWLVLMTAAEYVRTDITLRDQYPLIVAEANEAMQRLKDDNDAQYYVIFKRPAARGKSW